MRWIARKLLKIAGFIILLWIAYLLGITSVGKFVDWLAKVR